MEEMDDVERGTSAGLEATGDEAPTSSVGNEDEAKPRAQDKPPKSQKPGSKRRLWSLGLVLIVVVVLLFISHFQPVDVSVSYQLPSNRSALSSLRVTWEGDNDKYVESSFHYSGTTPPRREHQTLTLPPGSYQMRAVLEFKNGESRIVEESVEITQETAVEINLTPSP